MVDTLGIKLVLSTLLAVGVAFLTFIGIRTIAEPMITQHMIDSPSIEQRTQRDVNDLQTFIEQNEVTEETAYNFETWTQAHGFSVIYLYTEQGDRLVYTNNYSVDVYGYNVQTLASNENKIRMNGANYYVDLIYLISAQAQSKTTYLSFGVAMFVFVVLLFGFNNVLTRRIRRLTEEVEAIGAGDLQNGVTCQGNDELGRLTDQINLMIDDITQRQDEMVVNEAAMHELVTNLAHDLRTPLTALIGYLTLLRMGEPHDLDSYHKTLKLCESKAMQIKRLSDELFSLFTSMSLDPSSDVTRERLSLESFMSLHFNAIKHDLELKGFRVDLQIQHESEDVYVESNAFYMRRVFDNIVSNIYRYAIPGSTVLIVSSLKRNLWTFEIVNTINRECEHTRSTGFGLVSCQKILRFHGGLLESETIKDAFVTRICLPLEQFDK